MGLEKVKDKETIEIPRQVKFFEEKQIRVEEVACDSHHTIVRTKAGKLYSFGNGKYERFSILGNLFARTLCLGHERSENVSKPKLIQTLKTEKIKGIATNKHAALGYNSEGNLWVWGRGEFGVNGVGDSNTIATPQLNQLMSAIRDSIGNPSIKKVVSCSDYSSVLLSNGDVYSFGNNDYGNMGLEQNMGIDTTESISIPQPMMRAAMKIDGEPAFIEDIELGEQISLMKCSNSQGKQVLFWAGRKMTFQPLPVLFDFEEDPPAEIGGCEKGYAFTTKSGK